MKFSKRKTFLLFITLFLLDWAALHDIIENKESSYLSEYAMLAISVGIVGWVLYQAVKKD